MLIDLKLLESYYDRKLLIKQTHPTLPLTIWNYSRTAQFEKHWDDITLMCRGLITENTTGKIIALPVGKFFNMEELSLDKIPNEPFEVTEKMDGSLMIVFYYNDEWMIASRGSFDSEYALWGKQILDRSNTKYGLIPGWSYCMELIVPQNRIVVDYGDVEKLVVLCVFNLETGEEGTIDEMTSEGWEIVKNYDGIQDFKSLKKMISSNQEGFVVRFESGFRMKIKGDEYVRLHSLLTQVTSYSIWDYLRHDGVLPDELIERIPDEFDAWIRKTVFELTSNYQTIENNIRSILKSYPGDITDKKEFASWVETQDRKIQGILFRMYDEKSYSPIIWRWIKPKFEKAYRLVDDE